MRRNVEAAKRQMRLESFRLNSAGSLGEGSFRGSVVVNGAGDYTLSLNESFAREPVVVASPLSANRAVTIGTLTNSTVQLLVTDLLTDLAADSDLHILVMGSDVVDQE